MTCRICGRTATHSVEGVGYCTEHRDSAKLHARAHMSRMDRRWGDQEEKNRDFDRFDMRARTYRRTVKAPGDSR